jgi:hypothetical protein
LGILVGIILAIPLLVLKEEQMKDWKLMGFVAVASAAVLFSAGANGRAALWATPEGQAGVQAPQSEVVALADLQPSADADADNGPGCVESAFNR